MKVLPTFFVSKRMDEKCSGSFEMTDKRVKFCPNCDSSKCNVCDKTFDTKKQLQPSTFHQIKSDFTTFVTQNNSEIIVDIGCPNSVISIKDENKFRNNLNKFQQENLRIIEIDEKFKFGPSGPYRNIEKLRFPIRNGVKVFWADVAIVDANIPKLLGT